MLSKWQAFRIMKNSFQMWLNLNVNVMKTTIIAAAILSLGLIGCQKDETSDLTSQNASPVLVSEFQTMTGLYQINHYSKHDNDLTKEMNMVQMNLKKGGLMTAIMDDQHFKGTYNHDRRAQKIGFKIQGNAQMDILASAIWVVYRGEGETYKLVSEDGLQTLVIQRIYLENANPA